MTSFLLLIHCQRLARYGRFQGLCKACLLLCGLLLFLNGWAQAQAIRYVRANATGSGSSWADASGNLQAMINATGVQQVWVAQGTYKPGPAGNTNRDISFSMKNGVAIYGGFDATGTPSSLTARNPASFTTVLSGDIGTQNNNGDNTHHVINNPAGLTSTAILDGFVITAGNANGLGNNRNAGGGMYNVGSSPVLTNCSFVTNSTSSPGGGIYNENGSLVLTNCSFVNNTAGNGGGLYSQGSGTVLINCSFVNNFAGSTGGGLYVFSGNTTLTNCSFMNNRTEFEDSGAGTGMYTFNNSSVLTNCVAFGNSGASTFATNGGLTARYCLLEDGVTAYIDGGNNQTTTTSPFLSDTDPQLGPCSPAINAGDNTAYATANGPATDLAGNPRRFNNGVIDLGAYEYQGAPATSVAITQQPVSSSAVAAGANVRVPVGISGATTSLQWYNQVGIISGQTSATLTLNGVNISQSGSYSLVATSACNSLTTTAFTLTVAVPPSAPTVITPANGSYISDNTPACTGTAQANSTVFVYIDTVLSGTTTAGQTGSWSYSLSTPLTDAPHTVHAIARLNGLDSPLSNTNSFWVDTSAPETTFSATPPLITNSTSAQFRFANSEGGSVFQISLDGSEYVQRTFSNQPYSGLAESEHTFRVRAVDRAGNVDPTPATYTWTIDTTPPSVTISSSAGPSGSTITGPITLTIAFSEAVTGFGTDIIIVSNGTVANLATNDNRIYTVVLNPTSPGAGAVSVRVPGGVSSDRASNPNDPSNTYNLNYQPGPSLFGLAALTPAVCTGSPLTFTATVGNLTGAYTYTLTNGQDTPTTGSSSNGAFQQTLTAGGSGQQSYTLTVNSNGLNASLSTRGSTVQVNDLPVANLQNNGPLSCAQTSATLTASGGSTYSFSGPSGAIASSGNTAIVSQEGVYSVTVLSGGGCSSVASTTVTSTTALSAPSLQASSLSTSSQPISITASGCAGTINWLPQGGAGQATGNIYTFSQPGNYTLTATCSIGSCTSSQASPLTLQILPGGFAITNVTMVNCTLIDEAKGGYQVQFTPQYAGQNNNPISFSVVNEMPTSTAPPPYSLRLYNDNPVITLVANQTGNPEARFAYNWLASCQTGNNPSSPPTTSGIPNQTILAGQAYQLNLTDYFSDPDGQSLTFSTTGLPTGLNLTGSLISGTPSATGVSNVQVTALDPGGLSAQTSFALLVNAMPSTPAGFTIVGVSTVSCEVTSPGQRRVTFTPQYGGVDSSPVSFSIVNEMPATTNPGPYSLNLYTDNPSITLAAEQGTSLASYVYNWLAICTAPARMGARETQTGLQVKVLGNPVEGKSVEVEVGGVAGQSVQLNLVDMQGKVLHQQRLEEATPQERVSVPIGAGKGLLLLQVNTATEHQQVKLLKP